MIDAILDADLVLVDARIMTMSGDELDKSIIYDGAVVVYQGVIVWLGNQSLLPRVTPSARIESCGGQWLTPGLIDCHTHLLFSGNRSAEFEQRAQGTSYADIARQGGGIQHTVKETRAATESQLYEQGFLRAKAMIKQGVTSLEIKSGYGLNTETECRLLRVARMLENALPLTIKTTFLGAHALPPEYAGRSDEYIDYVCQHMLPRAAEEQLVDAVDVFCESIGFNAAQTEKVFQTAHSLGLPVKLHAEQLSNIGGSVLASHYQALSVDHIEYLDEAGVEAIAASDSVAVLLPGAYYCLHETQKPPIALLRKHKVPMAVATDFNPGSSPMGSLPLMMNMGCHLFGLSAEEALLGATINGAKALGIDAQVGSLAVGKQADIVSWNIDHPRDLVYQFGLQPIHKMWKAGKPIIEY
ncbi:imidazolonepropionase [Eionea flava]